VVRPELEGVRAIEYSGKLLHHNFHTCREGYTECILGLGALLHDLTMLAGFRVLQIMVGACATADNFMYKFGLLCG
jgi:hypothetical protein